ncbi:DUF560 domain-containing protein [Corticibacter populi]|uniref:DUF560 domain-containing protein n=1 Tax=Corticibacter populi TaxID=1550736 RepID=A0A3M6QY18_9BURK|nr:surface lipoprotein assembly modifier [Corticibacter populi]RMX07915.1 DUF560 domain-containing protein [Corticibacter populi]RZS35154.1 uncharacterized protein DUF560 [Corticibacter populi]
MCLKTWPLAFPASCVLLVAVAQAQPAAPVAPAAPLALPQDDTRLLQQQPQLQRRPQPGRPSMGNRDGGAPSLPQATDDDLRRDRSLTERVIEQAMLSGDWATLEHVMGFYPGMPGADPLLVDFVLGALARRDGRHAEAIMRYRRMLARDATLSYVRLDLAGMLMEDKRYQESARELSAVLSDMRLAPAARARALQEQQALAGQQGWSGRVALGWGISSNQNQGTDNDALYLPVGTLTDGTPLLWELLKDARDMPHGSGGPRLEAGAGRDFNIAGHHYLTLGASLDGVAWLRDSDFDRVNTNLRAGYKWQNVDSWLGASLIGSRMWLGGRPYSSGAGLSLDAGRWLTGTAQASGSLTWLSRRYDSERYASYEGHLRAVSANLTKVFSRSLIAFAGVALQDEDARGGEESSLRRTIQLGGLYAFDSGLTARASARYTRRRFDAPYSLFLWQERRDREYAFDASFWNDHWQIAGFTPKITLNYLRVKSTLYAYPRTEREVSLMLEKTF